METQVDYMARWAYFVLFVDLTYPKDKACEMMNNYLKSKTKSKTQVTEDDLIGGCVYWMINVKWDESNPRPKGTGI